MTCQHEHIKSVNGKIYCCECGAELPLELLTGKQEKPEKAQETEKKRATRKKA